jgi:hypothetical protein
VTYSLVPIINMGGKSSASDEFLLTIWDQMVAEDRVKWVFYDGSIVDEHQWLAFIKSPTNYPLVVVNDKSIGAIAWLNNYENKSARGHYCGLGAYHKEIGRMIMSYWKSFKDTKGDPILLTIVGITPETNTLGYRMLKILGFNIIGIIPHFCRMKYDGDKLVGGVISYCCPQGG